MCLCVWVFPLTTCWRLLDKPSSFPPPPNGGLTSVAVQMAQAPHSARQSDFQGRQHLFSPASSRRNRELVSSLRGDRKTGRLLRKTEPVKKRRRDTEMEDNKLSLSSAAVNGCSSAGLNANRPGVFRQAAGACMLTSPPL